MKWASSLCLSLILLSLFAGCGYFPLPEVSQELDILQETVLPACFTESTAPNARENFLQLRVYRSETCLLNDFASYAEACQSEVDPTILYEDIWDDLTPEDWRDLAADWSTHHLGVIPSDKLSEMPLEFQEALPFWARGEAPEIDFETEMVVTWRDGGSDTEDLRVSRLGPVTLITREVSVSPTLPNWIPPITNFVVLPRQDAPVILVMHRLTFGVDLMPVVGTYGATIAETVSCP